MRIKKLPEKIISTDWFIFIERRQPFFLMPTLFKPYFELFQRDTGICFHKQIYIFQTGSIFYLRSRKEFEEIRDYLAGLLLNPKNSERVEKWAKKGETVNVKADLEIEFYKSISNNQIKDPVRYRQFLDFFYELVFYSTVIPYFVLHASEHILKISNTSTEVDRAESIIKRFSPIRGESRYPQTIDNVVSCYWKYISSISKIDSKDLELLLPDEIELILQGKLSVNNIERLGARANCLTYLDATGEILIDYSISDIEKVLPKLEAKGELKGTVAYKGSVSGKVKIVNTASELGKVEQGDILVSINTNPSLMPAIKKAAGIVTNDGGITCHAAIISRELKIPCVVGTKIATRMLKDGDLVEVDANKGIVKIIS